MTRSNDYPQLDEWIARIHHEVTSGILSPPELHELREAFWDALSPLTMQGFALQKPHGYAGDFEIIDRIYQQYTAPEPHLGAWDRFFQQHAGAKAVRNRKSYFHQILDCHHERHKPLRVLNVASGPGRCMFEWLSAHQNADVSFHCIEIDARAIAYASHLNECFLDRIAFTQMNAHRFEPGEQFDLVWSAGLFDYVADDAFRSLLSRLLRAVAPGGELVVGNFSDCNPSRPYMELIGDWRLHHRSSEALAALALACGVPGDAIRVGAEPEGVNLFLHIVNHAWD